MENIINVIVHRWYSDQSFRWMEMGAAAPSLAKRHGLLRASKLRVRVMASGLEDQASLNYRWDWR